MRTKKLEHIFSLIFVKQMRLSASTSDLSPSTIRAISSYLFRKSSGCWRKKFATAWAHNWLPSQRPMNTGLYKCDNRPIDFGLLKLSRLHFLSSLTKQSRKTQTTTTPQIYRNHHQKYIRLQPKAVLLARR